MTDNQGEQEYVDVSFMDFQSIGTLPEPVNRMAGLVTKAAMGAFLAYFSLNELLVELRAYRANVNKDVNLDGTRP